MKFSSLLLYVNDEFPTKRVFEQVKDKGTQFYRKGKYLYKVEQEFISERYYWMYFQYDNENLYSDIVLDTSDNCEKQNPRPKSQVELRSQLFACYDFRTETLYVSDYAKKNVVSNYIADMLQVETNVKNIFKSLDDFMAANKRLKTITFTQKRVIQATAPDSILKKVANVYGLDLPEHAKIKLDYGASPIGIVKHKMQDWKRLRDEGEFENIVIVGIDDDGIENSFNFSTMVSAIEIELSKNDDDRYDPIVVQPLLIRELGR